MRQRVHFVVELVAVNPNQICKRHRPEEILESVDLHIRVLNTS